MAEITKLLTDFVPKAQAHAFLLSACILGLAPERVPPELAWSQRLCDQATLRKSTLMSLRGRGGELLLPVTSPHEFR